MKLLITLSLFVVHSAFAADVFHCTGTEPFWGAEISAAKVTFSDPGTAGTVEYPTVTLSSPGATSMEAVTVVEAKNATSSIRGFIVNEGIMPVAVDANTPGTGRAYCSDGMSEFLYPYSIHFFMDGSAYTGCCYSDLNPALQPSSHD